MTTREILINIVLLAVIGTLAYYIFSAEQKGAKDLEVPTDVVTADNAAPTEETTYDAEEGDRKFPRFGQKPLFQALLTPTPTPTPTPPPPTKTPDINESLKHWKLASADPGEATIEDKSKREDNMFQLKVNETRPVQAGDQVRNATLEKVDHLADNPYAIFGLDGTTEKRTIKMFEEGPLPPQ